MYFFRSHDRKSIENNPGTIQAARLDVPSSKDLITASISTLSSSEVDPIDFFCEGGLFVASFSDPVMKLLRI